MKFLNKETETLLQECIDNSSNFPKVLAEKFEGLSFEEDTRLRNRIKTLIDNGYFSKLQWADNVPWFGAITEEGYDYFYKKDVYIRAKIRERNDFQLLDKKTEKVLQKLIDIGKSVYVGDDDKEISEIMALSRYGYVSLVRDSGRSSRSDPFSGMVSLTEAGQHYFINKETIIDEIMALSEEPDIPIPQMIEKEAKPELSPVQNNIEKAEQDSPISEPIQSDRITLTGILGKNCGTVVP